MEAITYTNTFVRAVRAPMYNNKQNDDYRQMSTILFALSIKMFICTPKIIWPLPLDVFTERITVALFFTLSFYLCLSLTAFWACFRIYCTCSFCIEISWHNFKVPNRFLFSRVRVFACKRERERMFYINEMMWNQYHEKCLHALWTRIHNVLCACECGGDGDANPKELNIPERIYK